MNEMNVYEGGEFGRVRTFEDEGGNVWYCGKDVCDYLEYGNITEAMRKHVNEADRTKRATEFTKCEVGAKRVVQSMIYVNDGGLYSLVLHSKMPKARAFYEYLTHKVLPQIGKTGMYMSEESMRQLMMSPDFIIHIASEWKAEKAARIEAEERLLSLETENQRLIEVHAEDVKKLGDAFEEQKKGIMEEYRETENVLGCLRTTNTCILVRDMATILTQSGYRIGQQGLFKELVADGFLMYRKVGVGRAARYCYLPTQRSKDLSLFEVSEKIVDYGGIPQVSFTSKVTGKGQLYFVKYFRRKYHLEIDMASRAKEPMVVSPGLMEQTIDFV